MKSVLKFDIKNVSIGIIYTTALIYYFYTDAMMVALEHCKWFLTKDTQMCFKLLC